MKKHREVKKQKRESSGRHTPPFSSLARNNLLKVVVTSLWKKYSMCLTSSAYNHLYLRFARSMTMLPFKTLLSLSENNLRITRIVMCSWQTYFKHPRLKFLFELQLRWMNKVMRRLAWRDMTLMIQTQCGNRLLSCNSLKLDRLNNRSKVWQRHAKSLMS